jgi:hypothetical protein
MKLIAHRGLTDGPNSAIENHPDQLMKATANGFDCEIDLWRVNSRMWLGHDDPMYAIDQEFLETFRFSFWIHAKNLEALQWLTTTIRYTYFWHETDSFTLTNNNYIWTYPGQELTSRSIAVLPEWNDPQFKNLNKTCYGICSDYVNEIKRSL